MHSVQDESDAYMLLSTAVADIVDNAGNSHTCRVLLDNGLQSNYMTERMAALLNVPKYPVAIDVSGLNPASTEVNYSVDASISFILQKTKLGWVVSATIYPRLTQPKHGACHLSQTEVDLPSHELARFWEIEQVPSIKHLSEEERDCEDHFELHTTRSKTGRYIVFLRFNDRKKDIGDSYQMALRRFHTLENKFAKILS